MFCVIFSLYFKNLHLLWKELQRGFCEEAERKQ